MKLKKGDNILVISGKDKGRSAKILKSFPKEMKILVEGMNLKSKHVRPKKQGEKGQVVKISLPIDASNVKLLCPKCKKPVRIGYKIVPTESRILDNKAIGKNGKKFRICKKCKSEV